MPQFNEARRFVTDGIEPTYPLVQGTKNPWSVDRNLDGTAARGHYLAIQTFRDQLVVAQVSLLLRLRYVVTLARGGFSLPIDFSAVHFFDVDAKNGYPGFSAPAEPSPAREVRSRESPSVPLFSMRTRRLAIAQARSQSRHYIRCSDASLEDLADRDLR